jgi:hypothetical protein
MGLSTLIPWPYRAVAGLLLVLAAVLSGFVVGKKWEQGKDAREFVAATARVAKQDKAARVEVAREADKSEARAERTRIIYRDVIREVVKYAETDNGRSVCLNADWVRQHDRAAAPDLPATGGQAAAAARQPDADTAGSASNASNASILAVVATNYETCIRWREQVIGWQAWWRAAGLALQHE